MMRRTNAPKPKALGIYVLIVRSTLLVRLRLRGGLVVLAGMATTSELRMMILVERLVQAGDN